MSKSNRQARADFLEIEQKNRDRNKQAYKRKKEKSRRETYFVLLAFIALFYYIWWAHAHKVR